MADALTTILDALAARLGELAALATVEVEPDNPLPIEDLPGCEVYPGALDPAGEAVTGRDCWTWQITLSLTLTDDAGGGVLAALRNAQAAAVVKHLLAERTLGDLVADLRWMGAGEPYKADEGAFVTSIDLRLEVDFDTPEGDPTTLI
ncbi:MAG: hypothetical protein WD673_03950 [Alphaproteobacteria bacterium]